jgi:hypothetical protein
MNDSRLPGICMSANILSFVREIIMKGRWTI